MSESRIAALMSGKSVEWSDDLADAARDHGALPLIARNLRERGVPLTEPIQRELRLLAGHDAVRRRELDALFHRFAAAGVPIAVIKGEALARTLYAHSTLRPRSDTDLLVEREQMSAAEAVLRDGGYEMECDSAGEMIRRQRSWVRTDSLGVRHSIDLHWSVSNRQRYANVLPAADLYARGVGLIGSVRILSPADALLLAVVHLVGHHADEQRLIWLYDIHLLHAAMSEKDLETVGARARKEKFALALDAMLALALRWFGDGREAPAPPRRDELADLVDDLRHTAGVRPKLRLAAEHLFPPTRYMLHKYGAKRRALPALYLRRAVAGSARLLRKRFSGRS